MSRSVDTVSALTIAAIFQSFRLSWNSILKGRKLSRLRTVVPRLLLEES